MPSFNTLTSPDPSATKSDTDSEASSSTESESLTNTDSGPLVSTGSESASAPPPAVLRCNTTADFLAALPFLAGFTAENSLFIVLFQGKRSRNAIRLDLPPQTSQPAAAELLDAVCLILKDTGLGPEGSAIVITSEQTFAETGGAPYRQFARLLRRRFRREGWPLRDLAVVAPDGWAGLLDQNCPKLGRPLSEIGASRISELGRRLVGEPTSLEELGKLPEPDPERSAAVIGSLAELDRREAARRAPEAEPIGLPAWLHGVARVAGACFAPSEDKLEARLCARLIRASEVPSSWLVVLLSAVTRPEFVIDLAEDMGPDRFTEMPIDGTRISAASTNSASAAAAHVEQRPGLDYLKLLYSLAITAPEPAKLRRVIEVLNEVAAHTPEARRPGLLSLLAWSWWMLGLQSVATQLIEAALAIAPEDELPLMLERLLETPPVWTMQEETWNL